MNNANDCINFCIAQMRWDVFVRVNICFDFCVCVSEIVCMWLYIRSLKTEFLIFQSSCQHENDFHIVGMGNTKISILFC